MSNMRVVDLELGSTSFSAIGIGRMWTHATLYSAITLEFHIADHLKSLSYYTDTGPCTNFIIAHLTCNCKDSQLLKITLFISATTCNLAARPYTEIL